MNKKRLSEEQRVGLAKLLILMEVPKMDLRTILAAIETPEELRLFLDKLSERNYEMTPEEVYQAAGETINELL